MVGLTPEDVGKALSFKLAVEEAEAAKPGAAADIAYKKALTKEAEVRAERPFTIPGTDIKLSSSEARQWYTATTEDDRTAAVKNYEFYVKQQESAGETPKPFEAWNKEERTTKQRIGLMIWDALRKYTLRQRDIIRLNGADFNRISCIIVAC